MPILADNRPAQAAGCAGSSPAAQWRMLDMARDGAIDCDIHPALPGTSALLPYLDDYWREMLTLLGDSVERFELNAYPPNAPLTARPDWRPPGGRIAGSDFAQLQQQALDHFGLRFAICNCLHGVMAAMNPDFAAALCRAINDWMRKEWLDRDPRLRASIVISTLDPAQAVEEIERLAPDKRFVQVLTLAMGEAPLGRRIYWPILATAAKHQMPLGVHLGSMGRHAPTQSGHLSYFVEDSVNAAQGAATQMMSLISEGAFVKFPDLRLVLLESGVSWVPAALWRIGKDWRGVRSETPWVKSYPAQIMRDHVRFTIQPLDAPPAAGDMERLIEHLGSDDLLLFATDYPHWQFDGDDVMPRGVPAHLHRKIMVDNPLATYPRLGATP